MVDDFGDSLDYRVDDYDSNERVEDVFHEMAYGQVNYVNLVDASVDDQDQKVDNLFAILDGYDHCIYVYDAVAIKTYSDVKVPYLDLMN